MLWYRNTSHYLVFLAYAFCCCVECCPTIDRALTDDITSPFFFFFLVGPFLSTTVRMFSPSRMVHCFFCPLSCVMFCLSSMIYILHVLFIVAIRRCIERKLTTLTTRKHAVWSMVHRRSRVPATSIKSSRLKQQTEQLQSAKIVSLKRMIMPYELQRSRPQNNNDN